MTHFTVIGAGGFIGSRLVSALTARGEKVISPHRTQQDFTGEELGRVIYCAGLTGDFLQRPFDTVEAHVTLLANILKGAGFERLVYLSSTRVYDSLSCEAGGKQMSWSWIPICRAMSMICLRRWVRLSA